MQSDSSLLIWVQAQFLLMRAIPCCCDASLASLFGLWIRSFGDYTVPKSISLHKLIKEMQAFWKQKTSLYYSGCCRPFWCTHKHTRLGPVPAFSIQQVDEAFGTCRQIVLSTHTRTRLWSACCLTAFGAVWDFSFLFGFYAVSLLKPSSDAAL